MKEKKYKSLWSRKKVKAQLVTLLIVSSFFLNAFAQESSMSVVPPPDEVLPQSPLSEIDQPPSPLPVSAPEKSKTNEEKATQTIKVEKSKVYLDFRDTDIKDVARILSKISGVSMLVGENVKAKVTLNIEGVSWEKALELILKTYNLGSIKKDNFIIIVTYKEIQDQQDQIPLTTKIITLNFASLDDTKTYVKSMMTKRGTIETDKKTNSLIITDTPETIERILKITSELDKKTPQVLIEVWMIDKSLLSDWDFGIDWQVQDKNS
ncbi:MAG: secretin N-terminal domain-containing protein, partial [Candidatus Omnitrophota bacterium]